MDGMRFPIPIHGHGTLSANMVAHITLPCPATLVSVSAVATTAAVGKIDIGTDADADAYLDDKTFGASGVPTVLGRADFVGAEYPHFAAGAVITVTITHASMINPDAILWFLEG
jgi:hypothetical protein